MKWLIFHIKAEVAFCPEIESVDLEPVLERVRDLGKVEIVDIVVEDGDKSQPNIWKEAGE